MQFGDMTELQAEGKFAPEKAGSVFQSCKRLILLAFFTAMGDFYGRVA